MKERKSERVDRRTIQKKSHLTRNLTFGTCSTYSTYSIAETDRERERET